MPRKRDPSCCSLQWLDTLHRCTGWQAVAACRRHHRAWQRMLCDDSISQLRCVQLAAHLQCSVPACLAAAVSTGMTAANHLHASGSFDRARVAAIVR